MSMESTINKCKKSRLYTKISNALLQDDRLSLKEIGLMSYILSLPDNWTLCMTHLYSRYGRSAVTGALVTLKSHGYLSHRVEREAGTSRIIAHRWTAYDDPAENEESHKQVFQSVENPECGKPTATKEIEETKETQIQIATPAPAGRLLDIPPVVHAITAEQVYAAYPRKEARAAALKAIEEAARTAREAIENSRIPPTVFGPCQEFINGEGKWCGVPQSLYGMTISADAQQNKKVRWEILK